MGHESWPVLVAHQLGLPLAGSPLVIFLPYPADRVSPHLSGDGRGMRGQLTAVGSKMGDGW